MVRKNINNGFSFMAYCINFKCGIFRLYAIISVYRLHIKTILVTFIKKIYKTQSSITPPLYGFCLC